MLLQMKDIRVAVSNAEGTRQLLNLSELHVETGESVGIVGETGSGKTLSSLAITRLFPSPAIRLTGGSVKFADRELTKLPLSDIEKIRGTGIGMIFQDPSTSLNPVFRVGRTLGDLVRQHHKVGKKVARERAIDYLRQVELPHPEQIYTRYPFELSGGQRQRVMIAMALAGQPKLLIADEPTTALDVTIQAGILMLLRKLQREQSLSMLMITHNLGLVAHLTQRIYVMYGGESVETGPTKDVLSAPAHPYTRMLLSAIPSWHKRGAELATLPSKSGAELERLSREAGSPAPGTGCVFADRCPYAIARCLSEKPLLRVTPNGSHEAACHRLEELQHDAATS